MIRLGIEYKKFQSQNERNFENNDTSVIKGSLDSASLAIANVEQVLVKFLFKILCTKSYIMSFKKTST